MGMGPSKDVASYEVIDHMAKQVLFGLEKMKILSQEQILYSLSS